MAQEEFVIGEEPTQPMVEFDKQAKSAEANINNRDLNPKSGWKRFLEKLGRGTSKTVLAGTLVAAGGTGILVADQQTGGNLEGGIHATIDTANKTSDAAFEISDEFTTGKSHLEEAAKNVGAEITTSTDHTVNAVEEVASAVTTGAEDVHNAADAAVNAVVGAGEAIARAPADMRDAVGETKDAFVDAVKDTISPEDPGEGVEVHPVYEAELQYLATPEGKQLPTFRSDKNMGAHEYSLEELKKLGFDPATDKVTVMEVAGGTYPSDKKAGFEEQSDGSNKGKWGQVLINGKPTPIFIGMNYLKPIPREDQNQN